ncbi:venom metalloproteinase antarease-like TpachMP_A [Centruroides sculpturatus]|uniref:venom metalloproteinase antarease-like TpachMP_A n=1 Tax=Centruroides sculpturatus TaxID=218467 RepID=UPI000C6D229D|nr:venom metalloproteinase antarease-like TpachMP_A [Centruroides sculpturatus]
MSVTTRKKETEPSFIEQSAIRGAEEYLNPFNLLNNMLNYYCTHYTGLAKDADIIMLSVSRRLAKIIDDNTLSLSIEGITYLAGVCDCNKVGITFDNSDYFERVILVAHESAHLLGSPHDGDGTNKGPAGNPGALDCPKTDGYIMGDRSDDDKKYKFSECSKRCIEYLLS